ncbi:MAG: hypothetical protein WD054_03280 [Gemmatimonadota bacterium]
MTERRPLGTILLESGHISPDDVERVLEYQRTHGGFFGQALVALNLVRREEIDWALASQFDLPYIFPNADAVDRDAARLVPADWALAHMAVPIVRAGKTVTVVVADPLTDDVLDDLRTRTGCSIEMALASAARIRELIHAVYDAEPEHRLEEEPPVAFEELLAHALENGARRFGISMRAGTALGWWRTRTDTHRATLTDGWERALTECIQPSPLGRMADVKAGHIEWEATLKRPGADLPIAAQALVGVGGAELMFRPLRHVADGPLVGHVVLPPALIMELRLLWRGGSARIGVAAEQIDAARAVLPLLPGLGLGDDVRAVHINAAGDNGSEYTLRADPDPAFAEAVSAYEFDAITIDLPPSGYPIRELLHAAPLSFMLLEEPGDVLPAEWGINWLLMILGRPGSYAWDLHALHG